MFKNFLLKKMLRTQGVPEAQIEMFIKMMEKNPTLFQNIATEIKERVEKGEEEQKVALEVMKKYESELKKLI